MQLDWSEVGTTLIPLHGRYGLGRFAVVDGDYDGEYLSGFKWYRRKDGYIYREKFKSLDGNTSGVVYLHDMVCPKSRGMWIDHINRVKTDNRSVNLRAVTPKESQANTGPRTKRRMKLLTNRS